MSLRRKRSGEQQEAARVLVQVVDETGTLDRLELQGVEHGVEVLGGLGVALNGEARRLVEGEHVTVHMQAAARSWAASARPILTRPAPAVRANTGPTSSRVSSIGSTRVRMPVASLTLPRASSAL